MPYGQRLATKSIVRLTCYEVAWGGAFYDGIGFSCPSVPDSPG